MMWRVFATRAGAERYAELAWALECEAHGTTPLAVATGDAGWETDRNGTPTWAPGRPQVTQEVYASRSYLEALDGTTALKHYRRLERWHGTQRDVRGVLTTMESLRADALLDEELPQSLRDEIARRVTVATDPDPVSTGSTTTAVLLAAALVGAAVGGAMLMEPSDEPTNTPVVVVDADAGVDDGGIP